MSKQIEELARSIFLEYLGPELEALDKVRDKVKRYNKFLKKNQDDGHGKIAMARGYWNEIREVMVELDKARK